MIDKLEKSNLESKLLNYKWHDIVPLFGLVTNSMRNIDALLSKKSKHKIIKFGQYVPFLVYQYVSFNYTKPLVQEAITTIGNYIQKMF